MPYDACLLTDDLDLPVQQVPITGYDLVIQRIRLRLNTHRGEWPLDASAGVPYTDWMQTRPFPQLIARTTLVGEINGTPGVRSVTVVDDVYDPTTQTYTLTVDVFPDAATEPVQVEIQAGPTGNASPYAAVIRRR